MRLDDLARSPHFHPRLTLGDAERLTAADLTELRNRGWLLPMAGGDDGEGDDGAAGSSGDGGTGGGDELGGSGDGGASESGGSGAAGSRGSSGGDDSDGDGDGDDGAADTAELNRAKRSAAEAEKRARKAERALAQRQETDRKEQGKYEELYQEEQKKTADLATRISNGARDRSIVSIAQRLDFHNPQSAIKLVVGELPDDVVDMPDDLTEEPVVDEQAVEKALKRLAKAETYLVKETRGQSGEAGRGDRGARADRGNGDDGGRGESKPGVGTLREAFDEANRIPTRR